MGFSLFKKRPGSSAVIVDIGSRTMGGAYVHFSPDSVPIVSYSVRIPINFPEGDPRTLCMLRAFDGLIQELTSKGLPAFKRASGLDKPDRGVVSVGSLWQQTTIQTETIIEEKEFTFTQAMLANALAKQQEKTAGNKLLQKEVLAVLLNGYQAPVPFGKKAKRAEMIMLSSVMDSDAMTQLGKVAKRLDVRGHVLLAPFQSLVYAVLRAEFPHEKEFLVMQVSEESTAVLLANSGLLLDAASIPLGLDTLARANRAGMKSLPINVVSEDGTQPTPATELAAGREWIDGLARVFKKFATSRALPRILFLVSDEGAGEYLKKLLDTSELHSLWLSDDPLTVIPVVSRLHSSLIQHHGESVPDVPLDLIVLFSALPEHATD